MLQALTGSINCNPLGAGQLTSGEPSMNQRHDQKENACLLVVPKPYLDKAQTSCELK